MTGMFLVMTSYCIDSNIVIYTLDGLEPVVTFMTDAQNQEIIYPVIVEAELYSSSKLSSEDILDLGEIIEVNSTIGLIAGKLRRISRSKYNQKLKLPDALVAATAINQFATLITRNYDDFKHLQNEGLEIYNPFV